MVRSRVYISFIVLFFCANLSAQDIFYGLKTKEDRDRLILADRLFDHGSYYNAIQNYEQILGNVIESEYVTYKVGLSYFLERDYDDAAKYFGDFMVYENSVYVDAWYYYSQSLKMTANYNEARKYFGLFLKKRGNTEEIRFMQKIAKEEIRSCSWAFEQTRTEFPQEYEVSLLPGDVNHAYSDFAPMQIGDSLLVFTSFRHDTIVKVDVDNEDFFPVNVYTSIKEDDEWKSVKPYKDVNSFYDHTANTTIAPDGKKMFFSRCYEDEHGRKRCSLYAGELEEKSLKVKEHTIHKVEDAGINVDNYTTTQASLSSYKDKKGKSHSVLYFVSDRPGGKGGMDIWYSDYVNGTFTVPKNPGAKINTIGNEASPFYDGKTGKLYFSSNVLPGFGGLDVFMSEGDGTKFEDPENLGPSLNSSYDDSYYIITTDDEQGFLASNRPSGHKLLTTCCEDLFITKRKVINVVGIVYIKDSIQIPLDGVDIHIKVKDKEVKSVRTQESTGVFNFDVPVDNEMIFLAQKKGFEDAEIHLTDVWSKVVNDTLALDIFMHPIKDSLSKEDKLRIAHASNLKDLGIRDQQIQEDFTFIIDIHFDLNSAVIDSSSFPQIAKLIDVMEHKPDMRIEIGGHCDIEGSDDYNMKLSQRRADALKEHMHVRGIAYDRIQSVGYGFHYPIEPNEHLDGSQNKEGRAKNRRIEIKVL